MRRLLTCTLIVAVFGLALDIARAAPWNADRWFLQATAYGVPGTLTKMARPDFLLANSLNSMFCAGGSEKHPLFVHFPYQLVKYDPKHHIGLATTPHTDECSAALFEAPTPAMTVPNADLSRYATGRGLHIGSAYEDVLSVYGPPVKHGRHFVTSYSAQVVQHSFTHPRKQIMDPEQITLVIDNGRVSSILISIAVDCCD